MTIQRYISIWLHQTNGEALGEIEGWCARIQDCRIYVWSVSCPFHIVILYVPSDTDLSL